MDSRHIDTSGNNTCARKTQFDHPVVSKALQV